MSNSKISALTSATTPLAGTETLPIVQSSTTKQVSVANLTAGRAVNASSFTAPTIGAGSGSALSLQSNGATYATLDTAGDFLVNQTSAVYASAGRGVLEVNGTSTSIIANNLAGSNGGYIYHNGTTYTLNNVLNYSLIFSNNNTEKARIDTSGNYIPKTATTGINFTANTPAAGKTSQLLNWYEEGTWTPSTAFATFVGAASSSGTYTRVGRQVTVNGTLTGATSVTVGASGILTSSLPFNASYDGIGSMAASTNTASGVVRVTGPFVVAVTTMAAVASITFTATYFV